MSSSETSTIPNTPDASSDDYPKLQQGEVFAWLRPASPLACKAFDATVNFVIKHAPDYDHCRQFLHCDSKERKVESFTIGEDAQLHESTIEKQWVGSFGFRLNTPPQTPGRGWSIGTDYPLSSPEGIDLLLTPPNKSWTKTCIAQTHAWLSFHQDSCRPLLVANHTVTLGTHGAEPFRQTTARVIEDGELVIIGNCAYVFKHTELCASKGFEHDLSVYMREHHEPHWTLNRLISPSAVGQPILKNGYYCSPRVIAQGTFGKVGPAWSRAETAVAIKTFKAPDKENVLQLLESEGTHDTEVVEAYCIYAPLAVASLTQGIADFSVDIAAKLALFADYARGLAFLHGQHGIMHRDINPNNLAVTSLRNPRGIIIDLDAATDSGTSYDHMQGTISYLAPEIINLKNAQSGQTRPPYNRGVDIWALGLSMHALYINRLFLWENFGGRANQKRARQPATVDDKVYVNFQNHLATLIINAPSIEAQRHLYLIQSMVEVDAHARPAASDCLAMIPIAQQAPERGTIIPRGKHGLGD
ncbi:MAG: hypothetical protein Q9220_005630 [cf. Caloplaca sp. 1 TL-2023]